MPTYRAPDKGQWLGTELQLCSRYLISKEARDGCRQVQCGYGKAGRQGSRTELERALCFCF